MTSCSDEGFQPLSSNCRVRQRQRSNIEHTGVHHGPGSGSRSCSHEPTVTCSEAEPIPISPAVGKPWSEVRRCCHALFSVNSCAHCTRSELCMSVSECSVLACMHVAVGYPQEHCAIFSDASWFSMRCSDDSPLIVSTSR